MHVFPRLKSDDNGTVILMTIMGRIELNSSISLVLFQLAFQKLFTFTCTVWKVFKLSLRLSLQHSLESCVLTSQALHLCPAIHGLLCFIILTSRTVLAACNTETRTFTHEPRALREPDHRGILEMGRERPVAQFLFWPLSGYYPHPPAARKMVAVWKWKPNHQTTQPDLAY